MGIDEIKRTIIKILQETFAYEKTDSCFQYADLIEDLGMDSLKFISIIVEIEDAFQITISDEMLVMENFKCIDDIVKIVTGTQICNKETYTADY